MNRLPGQQQRKPNRRLVAAGVVGVLIFCYLTQFGFTLNPGGRVGHGMFDHERPQAVQDAMTKRIKEKHGIVSNTNPEDKPINK